LLLNFIELSLVAGINESFDLDVILFEFLLDQVKVFIKPSLKIQQRFVNLELNSFLQSASHDLDPRVQVVIAVLEHVFEAGKLRADMKVRTLNFSGKSVTALSPVIGALTKISIQQLNLCLYRLNFPADEVIRLLPGLNHFSSKVIEHATVFLRQGILLLLKGRNHFVKTSQLGLNHTL
jgi:hypothetical protein